ncbi:alpha/beta fold hydrolase [Lactococcus lactis]|nr:alpha/beta fold hydrolase [Lactococcus lactis]
MKIDKKIITIDGFDYAVRIWGTGEVLFALHGFSESSNTWRNLHLAGYKIVAIDLLGHGSSAKPKALAPYKLEAILTNLHLLFAQFTDGNAFSLLGYSMGGRLALRYCLAYPSAPVKYLILESTGPGLLSSEDRQKRRLADEELGQKILLNGSAWFADFWANISLFKSQKNCQ